MISMQSRHLLNCLVQNDISTIIRSQTGVPPPPASISPTDNGLDVLERSRQRDADPQLVSWVQNVLIPRLNATNPSQYTAECGCVPFLSRSRFAPPAMPVELQAEATLWTPKQVMEARIEAWASQPGLSKYEHRERNLLASRMLRNVTTTGIISKLSINNSEYVTCLPNGAKFNILIVTHCSSLTCLGENIEVRRALRIQDCSGLTQLSNIFRLPNNCSITNCANFRQLAGQIYAFPDNEGSQRHQLSIAQCPELTQLANSGRLELQELQIGNCAALQSIFAEEGELRIDGSGTKLQNCPQLQRLPGQIQTMLDGPTAEMTIVRCPILQIDGINVEQQQESNAGITLYRDAETVQVRPYHPPVSQELPGGRQFAPNLTIDRSQDTFIQASHVYQNLPAQNFAVQPHVIFSGEIGIDAGGLAKDFANLLSRAIFDPENKMFDVWSRGAETVCPNPVITSIDGQFASDTAAQTRAALAGKLLAMIFRSGLPWSQHLHPKMIDALKQHPCPTPENLADCHAMIKEMDPKKWQKWEDLRQFSAEELEAYGLTLQDDNAVTPENASDYIDEVLMQDVNNRWAFMRTFWVGFAEVVGQTEFAKCKALDAEQISIRFSGKREPINDAALEDWQANTTLFSVASGINGETIKARFFAALRLMTEPERAAFLESVTGYTCMPVGGFANLQKTKFSLTVLKNSELLPQGHTCFNRLDLPAYATPEKMAAKIRQYVEYTKDGSFGAN